MCADAIKCLDKLWLKDCLIEMKELGYSSNDIKVLETAETWKWKKNGEWINKSKYSSDKNREGYQREKRR